MIALDLFCGAGGASKGLLDAGFKSIIGVDFVKQPEYYVPEDFRKSDAFDYVKKLEPRGSMKFVDFIWASPPCQAYSFGSAWQRKRGKKYPDLIGKTRKLLLKTGKPFVIENVIGAPLRKDLLLCGEMFNLRIIRHRIFEIHGFDCLQPTHQQHKKTVGKTNKGKGKKNRSWYFSVSGHGGQSNSFSLNSWQKAMQIDWISNKKTLTQCVPPKYAEYIGKQFLKGFAKRIPRPTART